MKVLIVDDEILTLKNLAGLDWSSAGIEKVLTAENGADACEIALRENPEVILTDIEMPEMSGISLAEKLSPQLPEAKFIFLTAHDDFDYAQAAVANHILAYILKPFDGDELLDAVKKAADMVKAERTKSSYHDNLVKQLDRSRHFLMGYFFDMLDGSDEDVENLLQILNIHKPDAYYTVINVTFTSSWNKSRTADYKIFMELNQLFTAHEAVTFSFFNAAHLVYFVADDTPFAPTQTQSVVLTLADTAKKHLDESGIDDYLITIGNSALGIRNCEAAYHSALNAIAYSNYLGYNTIICTADVESPNTAGYFQAAQDEQFFNLVKAGNFEGAHFLLQRMFRSFNENKFPLNEIQHICHSILVQLALCLVQCGQNPDFLFNKSNALDVIRQKHSAAELESFMTDTIDVVTSYVSLNQSQKNQDLIASIEAYIKENPCTSRREIAGHFHHSPNYLSRIFLNETGNTIKSRIIEIRIACAKELLKNSNKSIIQISEEVGYKTQQHFSNVFSKATGMTPSEYRNRN